MSPVELVPVSGSSRRSARNARPEVHPCCAWERALAASRDPPTSAARQGAVARPMDGSLCEHVFVREHRYNLTEFDPQRPWVVWPSSRSTDSPSLQRLLSSQRLLERPPDLCGAAVRPARLVRDRR